MKKGGKIFSSNQIVILSTDLRDGAQTPGVNFDHAARLEIAERLHSAGVDVIEAGFPISSPQNARTVAEIARGVGFGPDAPVIASFARTGRYDEYGSLAAPDIDAAWEAVRDASFPRLHIVGTGSDLHLRKKYRSEGPAGRSRETNIDLVVQSIYYAAELMQADNFVPDIEFSPEDCSRADRNYLVELFGAAIEAGATTLNITDTVGTALPEDYGSLVADLRARVPNGDKVIWSTHTHNDLGLAAANALAGITNGAQQVEGTFIGLGERAGNTCLEQIVTILRMHGGAYANLKTRFDLTQLPALTHRIAELAGLPVPHSAPIIGKNAFRHKSGMHQDGLLKAPEVYQDIPPEWVGRVIELELGPDSGNAGLLYCARRLGYEVSPESHADFYRAFKSLADRIGFVEDEHLLALLEHLPYATQALGNRISA